MNIKTVTTIDGVNTVDFGSAASRFYWFRNIGTTTVYVSGNSDISAGGDGVAELPSGGSVCIETLGGKVYILGEGKVQIHNTGDKFCPFRNAPVSGDGGKTATVSNPNLLINPDFSINQRGISGTKIPDKNADGDDIHTYFVDRWGIDSGSVTINADGTLTLNGTMSQILENAVGTNVTASVSAGTAVYDDTTQTFTITGNGDVISWAKLEYGNAATAFIPPDPATELMKCMRYYEKIVCSNGMYNVACQYFNNLKAASFSISMMPKRVKTPTSMIDYSDMTYVNSENLVKVSSAYANDYTNNSVSIVASLSAPTTTCTHGWIVAFTIEIDAEIY